MDDPDFWPSFPVPQETPEMMQSFDRAFWYGSRPRDNSCRRFDICSVIEQRWLTNLAARREKKLLTVPHVAHLVLFDARLCRDKTILLNVPHLIDIYFLRDHHVASLTVNTVDVFELKATSWCEICSIALAVKLLWNSDLLQLWLQLS